MGFVFSEVFWGVLLIFIGASVIIKGVFHVSVPIFPIIVAFILIYGGIRILMGGGFGFSTPQNMVMFNDATITVTNPKDSYSVMFGRGVFDLSAVTAPKDAPKVNINTIFGGGVIKLNPETPVKVVVNSAFAEATMPDGNKIQFGNIVYQSKNYREGQNSLLIEANVVFGGLEIVDR